MAIVGPANRAVAQNSGTSMNPKFDVLVAGPAYAVFMSSAAIEAAHLTFPIARTGQTLDGGRTV